MAKFSTTFLQKLTDLATKTTFSVGEGLQEGTNIHRVSTPLYKGSSLIDAGDVIYFAYKGKERLFYVTRARGGTGTYITPKNNKVISGFLINDSPVELIASVLEGLYKSAERHGLPVRMLFFYKTLKSGTQRIDGHIHQLNVDVRSKVISSEE